MRSTLKYSIWGVVVVTALIYPLVHKAQNRATLKFDSYSTHEGLSHGNVACLYQDQFGFIWIGTDDGLNVYDGVSFKVYRNEYHNESSLIDSRALSVLEDLNGHVWIGSDFGLSRYDRKEQRFDRYQNDPANANSFAGAAVSSSIIDKNGDLWFGSSNGVSKYRKETDDFVNYRNEPGNPNSLIANNISGMTLDKNGNLWISTRGGLSMVSEDGKSFDNYSFDSDDFTLSSNDLRAIFCDSKNRLWLGHFETGITRIDLNRKRVKYFAHDAKDPSSLSNNYVQWFAENEAGEIWIASDNGLNRYFENDTFHTYYSDPNDEYSLSSDITTRVIFDQNQNMWVGTRLGGICHFDKDKYGFTLFRSNPSDPKSLSSDKTAGFAEAPDGNFAVATDGGGVNFYDRRTKTFSQLKHDPNNRNSLTNNKVLALAYDERGGLWIGMWSGGVNYYNLRTGRVKHYKNDPNDPKSLSGNNIFQIFNDSKGDIWVGTWGAGICKYNWATDDWTSYGNLANAGNFNSTGINHIREDKLGQLWFADESAGIIVLNPKTGRAKTYKAEGKEGDLSNNSTSCTLEDSKGRIWVATIGGGLNLLDKSTDKFTVYRKMNGLPSEGIVGILEDNQGYIWASTNNGLSRLDPETMTFKNYTVSDGLQDNQFNPRNRLKLSTGELLFGGNGGFNLFNPSDLKSNTSRPVIYFVDFKLNNKPVSIGADQPLKQSIFFTKELVLDYTQNFLSFEYIGLNFRNADENTYSYIMEGLQDEWVEAGSERKASYTFIEPGEYVFKVMAANNDGIQSKEAAAINVIITPPFWETWWFRGTVVLLLVIVGRLFYKYRVNKMHDQQLELENMVNEATAQVNAQNEELQAQSASLKMAIQDTNYVLKEALESGNFKARIDLEGKEGEWKALGESINQLFDSVMTPFNDINKVATKMAEGDLTERFTAMAKGDVKALADNLNKAMDNLSDLLSDITNRVGVIDEASDEMLSTSVEMNASTGEIASSIAEMSKGAQEQVVKVDESSNLIEGILSSSNNIGDQADSINQTAQLGVSKSENGMQQMEKLDLGMKDILQFSRETNDSIDALTKRSEEISGVIRIIKDIASQTNLLALNAAIEAAQAGDAGRGFAVVAEEIRKLAEDSKKSAGEIEELIMAVQTDTSSTAKLISGMNTSIKQGEAATIESKSAFEEITKYYAETLKKSEDIASATKQQTEDIGNVVKIINSVVVIAEETAAGTEQTASSSSELSVGMTNFGEKTKKVKEIVDDLRKKVGRFILNKVEELV